MNGRPQAGGAFEAARKPASRAGLSVRPRSSSGFSRQLLLALRRHRCFGQCPLRARSGRSIDVITRIRSEQIGTSNESPTTVDEWGDLLELLNSKVILLPFPPDYQMPRRVNIAWGWSGMVCVRGHGQTTKEMEARLLTSAQHSKIELLVASRSQGIIEPVENDLM